MSKKPIHDGGADDGAGRQARAAYVIGIDLGTTNSALAYSELHADADPFVPVNVQLLPVPQLTNPGEVASLLAADQYAELVK